MRRDALLFDSERKCTMSAERDAGIAAYKRGDLPAALQALERAREMYPNDYDTYLYLGAAYGQSSRNDEAVAALTQAVQLQPSNPQARFNLGVALERAGWRGQALTALQQALTLQPNYPAAQQALQRLQAPVMPAAAAPYAAPPVQNTASPMNPAMPSYRPGYAPPVYSQPPAAMSGTTNAPYGNAPYGSAPYGTSPYVAPLAYPVSAPTAYRPAPAPSGAANLGVGILAALVLTLLCGLAFGFGSVALGMRIPFVSIAIGYIVGYAMLKAVRVPGHGLGVLSAVSAVIACLLGLLIMYLAGIIFSPISFLIVGYAGFRAYRIASGM
jgi:hypothetical protein